MTIKQVEAKVRAAPAEALQDAENLFDQFRRSPNPAQEVQLRCSLAAAYLRLGRIDEMRASVAEALELARRTQDREGEGNALYWSAVGCDVRGELAEAVRFGRESVAVLEGTPHLNFRARSLSVLGTLYWRTGEAALATEVSVRAVEIAEKTGEARLLGLVYNNLGVIFRRTGRSREAVEQYRKAANVLQALGDDASRGTTLTNLGGVLMDVREFPEAQRVIEESVEIARRVRNVGALFKGLANLASLHHEIKENAKAIAAADEALALNWPSAPDRAMCLGSRARARRELGDRAGARADLQEALQLITASNDVAYENLLTAWAADVSAEEGDYAAAFHYSKRTRELSEKLLKEANEKQLNELEKKFELQRSRDEIQALQLKNLEAANELQSRTFRQRLLWISLGASTLGVLLIGGFLAQARRSHRRLNRSYQELQAATRQLKESQQRLAEASRVAGMAQVATQVVHTIGNAVSSINVSAVVASERLGRAGLTSLEKLDALLAEQTDLPAFFASKRGQMIPSYIELLTRQIRAEHGEVRQELERITEGLENIAAIVRLQQEIAGGKGVIEELALSDLVDTVLRLHEVVFARTGIRVVRDLAPVPAVLADRHRCGLILTHLLTNAKEAMENVALDARLLTVQTRQDQDGGVRIAVADCGMGIAAGDLTRIFAQGNSTKGTHRGYGLHTSANAATEMGARLSAESPGLGQGATFSLIFPRSMIAPSQAESVRAA